MFLLCDMCFTLCSYGCTTCKDLRLFSYLNYPQINSGQKMQSPPLHVWYMYLLIYKPRDIFANLQT